VDFKVQAIHPAPKGSTDATQRVCSAFVTTVLTIIAPGLLGASVAQAARRHGAFDRIKIWARRSETRIALKQVDWCDEVADTPSAAVNEANIVVVCTPVDQIVALIQAVCDDLSSNAVVTDVGSVKGEICRFASSALKNGAQFVGSHPMAGSEKSGMEHASADLFMNRPCFVTPLEETPAESVDQVVAFWTQIGAEVVTLSPDRHDEIVAHISHLPHLAASALCSLLARHDPSWRQYAGAGLRDTTRVAGGSPSLWLEILFENRDEVIRALASFQDELQAFNAALSNHNMLQLKALLERGKDYRDQFRPR
jgi:prephenate dehydrogenase